MSFMIYTSDSKPNLSLRCKNTIRRGMIFLTNFIETLNAQAEIIKTTYSQETLNIAIGFLAVSLVLIVLRIVLYSCYQTQHMIFNSKSKKYMAGERENDFSENNAQYQAEETDGDFTISQNKKASRKSKISLISKVINDCQVSINKGATNINVDAITKKHLNRLRLLFWSYRSMEDFISNFENGLIIMGFLMAMFFEEKSVYVVLTCVAFIAFKVLGTLFNFSIAKEKLIYEIIEFVEREIVNVDSSDLNGLMRKLSKDIYLAVTKQSDVLKESIDIMGTNLTGALALSMSEMTKAVNTSIDKSANFFQELSAPLGVWKESIESASLAQEKFNLSSELLNENTINFSEASKVLTENFKSYIENTEKQGEDFKNTIGTLTSVITELKDLNENSKVDLKNVAMQLETVETNQNVLENAVQKYETSLEGITSKLGESLADIVELQMQNSYIKLNDILLENISVINSSNKETVYVLQGLFEDLRNQTRNQTQTIVNVKEQMDMQFENIRERI